MPVAFHCSACQHSAKLRDDLLGKKIKCPKCQAVGMVGEEAPSKTKTAASKPSGPVTSGKGGSKKAAAPADDPDDFIANLGKVKLDKYADYEPSEEELEEEEQAQEEAAKAARKSKKKKGGEKANTGSENKGLMMAMTGLCGIVALLVLAGVWFYVLPAIGGPAAAMTPPEKFKKFDHLNGEFHVDVPDGEGWEVKDSGSNTQVSPWLKIKKGTVIIEIRQDEAGGAVAAAAGTGSAGQDMAATLGIKGINGPNASDPSESRMIFDRYSNKSQENFKMWESKSPQPIQTHMGEGRIASVEFQETALSPKRKGVLAAMFPSKAYTILCYCDDGNYAAMRPFFEKIIVSMQPVVNGQVQDMMH